MAFQVVHSVMLVEAGLPSATFVSRALSIFPINVSGFAWVPEAESEMEEYNSYLAYIIDEDHLGRGSALARRLLSQKQIVIWIGPEDDTPEGAIPCPKPIQLGELQRHFEQIFRDRLPKISTKA